VFQSDLKSEKDKKEYLLIEEIEEIEIELHHLVEEDLEQEAETMIEIKVIREEEDFQEERRIEEVQEEEILEAKEDMESIKENKYG
jgi:hypothetical protein